MSLVTYPKPETKDERKAREKRGEPQPTFSFTVRSRDDSSDEAVQKLAEAMRKTKAIQRAHFCTLAGDDTSDKDMEF